MNRTVLIGRLTKDVDLRYTQSNRAVANFTLAVQRPYSNANGEKETDFFDCVCWGKAGETFSNHVKKGNQIAVSGNLQTRTYQANDGTKRKVVELNVGEFTFLESRNTQSREQQGYNEGMQEYNQRVESRQNSQSYQAPQQNGYGHTNQTQKSDIEKAIDQFADFGRNDDDLYKKEPLQEAEGNESNFDTFDLPF